MTRNRHDEMPSGASPMFSNWHRRHLSRRNFLRLGGGALAATAGAAAVRGLTGGLINPVERASGIASQTWHLAATDGFISLPGTVGLVSPDPWAPTDTPDLSTWVLGFRDVTGLSQAQIQNQKFQVGNPAPLLFADEGLEVDITLSNLGLQMRPDLTDSHTIHWHGFRNAIPLYDGVPELSIAVPTGRDFNYVYFPYAPGTYMYHCHFEDVEHVSMGMTGIVFVRPRQNRADNAADLYPSQKFAYNDGDGSTGYDREFALFLSEMWAQEHYDGVHIQEHDWSEYHPDWWVMNGRSYPDTIEGHGHRDATTGDLVAPAGAPHLKYQPISSLIQANVGERILLRFVNLGFQQHAMTLDGFPMTVVGRDATFLSGRDGTDLSYQTNVVHVGPGESFDVIFTPDAPGTYLLYNRELAHLHNPGLPGRGGQLTEVRVGPAGTYEAQTTPNGLDES